ncbi:MAG TPA: hypothetical protein VMW17_17820 [Candidatus Binatia bacterium]|nr:hypothetical protein [Candidatus Binatia bacterium]
MRVRWSWAAASVLLIADLFLHKPISDVCDALVTRYGWTPYNQATLVIVAGSWISIVAALLWWNRERLRQPPVVAAVMLLGAATLSAYHWMLVANVELIHLPQYALIAAVLLLGGNTPSVAWLGTTAAGVIDEIYQQVAIYAGTPDTYLDFNDMVLNAIGASWAVVLLVRAVSSHATDPRRWSAPRVVAVLAALLAVSLWLDPPTFTPLLRHAKTGRDYRVMSAAEGLVAGMALFATSRLGTSDISARSA